MSYDYKVCIIVDDQLVSVDEISDLFISADGRQLLGLFALGFHTARKENIDGKSQENV